MTPIFAAYEITFLNNQALRRHSHVDSISTKMFELAAALRGNAKRLRMVAQLFIPCACSTEAEAFSEWAQAMIGLLET